MSRGSRLGRINTWIDQVSGGMTWPDLANASYPLRGPPNVAKSPDHGGCYGTGSGTGE